MRDSAKKTALITGAGTGLGKSIAKHYLQSDINVIITGRRGDVLEATKEELTKHGSISTYCCDIRKPHETKNLKQHIEQKFKVLDILINNAGILGTIANIEHYPEETWEDVITTNINGTFHITKACIPLLRRSSGGIICNISSSLARESRARWGAYNISKQALEVFSAILGKELSHTGIRVYSVNPGALPTDMRRLAYPEEDPKSLTDIQITAELFLEFLANHDICEDTLPQKIQRYN